MSDLQRQLSRIYDEKRFHLLRHLPHHLADLQEFHRLYALLTNIFFLEAKAITISVYDLADDGNVATCPIGHPQRHLRLQGHRGAVLAVALSSAHLLTRDPRVQSSYVFLRNLQCSFQRQTRFAIQLIGAA